MSRDPRHMAMVPGPCTGTGKMMEEPIQGWEGEEWGKWGLF